MFNSLYTFIQQDVSSIGDELIPFHLDDLDLYSVSSEGFSMIIIALFIIAAAIVLVLIVRRVGKSSSNNNSNNSNNKKPTYGKDKGVAKAQYTSFYVSDDGTIVRGGKESAGTSSSSVIVESQNEQIEALSLIKESAEAGVAEAQYYLGLCYEQGTVVQKDLEVAKKWYRLAASQSYPQAKFRLGKLMMEDKQ
jgi:TPR repeat protein